MKLAFSTLLVATAASGPVPSQGHTTATLDVTATVVRPVEVSRAIADGSRGTVIITNAEEIVVSVARGTARRTELGKVVVTAEGGAMIVSLTY